jgi:hypothetical protein
VSHENDVQFILYILVIPIFCESKNSRNDDYYIELDLIYFKAGKKKKVFTREKKERLDFNG